MYKIFQNRKVSLITLVITVISIGSTVYLHKTDNNGIQHSNVKTSKFQTINPQYIEGSSSIVLIGKFISNEVANIYPRRSGIIKDILVDIGDSVQEGQVLATLLPAGVEDQSKYKIAEKYAKYDSSKALLNNEVIVSSKKIIDLERRLENKLELEKNIIENALENIGQKKEQAETATYNLRQVIENILVSEIRLSRDHLTESDINPNLGVLDNENLKKAVDLMNDVVRAEEDYLANGMDLNSLISKISELANTLQIVLNNTITGIKLSRSDVDLMQHKLHTSQDKLYKAREGMEDAFNNHSIISSQYKTEIESLKTQIDITKSNNTKNIQLRENELKITQSSLNTERAVSGNAEVTSPFTGVISARYIDIGEMANMQKVSFTLTEVSTSLSNEAKNEIKFELPEEYIDSVGINDEIRFFTREDEQEVKSAKIFRKSSLINKETHTVTVQAKYNESNQLAHNTSVRVRLKNIDMPIYKIPSIHAKRENDSNYVWILSGSGEVKKLQINLLSEDGEFAEIVGDISQKTEIIINPPL